jgi:hypothetical protein
VGKALKKNLKRKELLINTNPPKRPLNIITAIAIYAKKKPA